MPQKLLLADDSVTVQRVIELTFADEGMTVVTVGDGRQAIESIERERPDIVLADATMPVQDGYEVAAHVKGTPALAHIPVVLMTGAFEQVDEARAREVGCDGVLAKPFEPHMVIALVRQLLGTERGRGAPAAVGALAGGYPFEPAASPSTSPSLDDYFDRLDEALAAHQPADGRSDARADGEPPAASPPIRGAVTPAASSAASPLVPPPAPPSLADAFSDMLADELGEAPARLTPWPPAASRVGSGPPAVGATEQGRAGESVPAVTDALVDEVTRRVIERFADSPVRDVVSATVLEVAERLVREEIQRIKSEA